MATLFLKIVKQRKTFQKVLLLIPGIVLFYIVNAGIIHNPHVVSICGRLTMVYMIIVGLMVCNSLLLGFEDIYSRSGKIVKGRLKVSYKGSRL